MQRFKDKIALVTGAARGMGKTVAGQLLAEGAKVFIADILEKEAQETEKEFLSTGYDVATYIVDVSSVEQIYACVEACVDKYGRIDVLVNCAGVQKPCPSMKVTEQIFDFVMDIDIKGTFFMCQAVGRVMRKQGGGVIVNYSSATSQMSLIGRLPYVVAKRGVNALTAVLGAEWGMYHIRVNAISPGWINTAMVEYPFKMGYLSYDQIMSVLPVEKLGEEHEIADLTLYLASDESSYITGQTIFSDGGWSTGILPNALDYIKQNDGMND